MHACTFRQRPHAINHTHHHVPLPLAVRLPARPQKIHPGMMSTNKIFGRFRRPTVTFSCMSRPEVAFLSRETGNPARSTNASTVPLLTKPGPTLLPTLLDLSLKKLTNLSTITTTHHNMAPKLFAVLLALYCACASAFVAPSAGEFWTFFGSNCLSVLCVPFNAAPPMCSVHAGSHAAVEHARRAAVTCESLGYPSSYRGLVMELLMALSLHKAALL